MTLKDDNNSNGQFWPGKANKVPDVEIQYLNSASKKNPTRYAGPRQHNKQVQWNSTTKQMGKLEIGTKTYWYPRMQH